MMMIVDSRNAFWWIVFTGLFFFCVCVCEWEIFQAKKPLINKIYSRFSRPDLVGIFFSPFFSLDFDFYQCCKKQTTPTQTLNVCLFFFLFFFLKKFTKLNQKFSKKKNRKIYFGWKKNIKAINPIHHIKCRHTNGNLDHIFIFIFFSSNHHHHHHMNDSYQKTMMMMIN